MNTWFAAHPRRQYTRNSRGDRARNQIDHLMINERYRSSISNAGTCEDRVSCIEWYPTDSLASQNEYILNHKHNVGSKNLDLKRIEFELKPIKSNEFNRMN